MTTHGNRMGPLANRRGSLIHGDCRDVLAQKSFPLVDLVHTSPPYNIDKPYQDYTDRLHLGDYLKFVSRVAGLLSQKMRVGGSLFWQTGYTHASPNSDEINPIDIPTFPLFKEHGFYLKDRIIWRYYGGMSFKAKFKNQHETILWYVKGDPENPSQQPHLDIDAVRERSREPDPRNNLLGRNPGNVWEVDRVAYGSIEQTSHIAVFPEEVTERIIRACSKPEDVVLDPFLGSGTVAKVAKSLGRKYVGIEISRGYYEESLKRLGFQQFGEVDTVLSELLKGFLLQAGRQAASHDCRSYFRELLRTSPSSIEVRVSKWCSAFAGVNGFPKKEKPKLWSMGEEFVERISSVPTAHQGLLAKIAFAYWNSYKLAKHFNGLRLALIAAHLQHEVVRVLESDRKIDVMVDRIVEEEPSSYKVDHKWNNVLKQLERRIKHDGARRKVMRKRAPEAEHALLFE